MRVEDGEELRGKTRRRKEEGRENERNHIHIIHRMYYVHACMYVCMVHVRMYISVYTDSMLISSSKCMLVCIYIRM